MGRASLHIPLRRRDIDSLGHLTHSVYHDFLAEGRSGLIRALVDDLAAVLVHVEIDYRAEVRQGDRHVTVITWIDAVGTRSVSLGQRIERSDGAVAAESSSILVAWDGAARSSRPLSATERRALGAGD